MHRRLTTLIQILTAVAALVLLAGCSLLSPYSDLTKLNLKLTASDQLNPDLHGRPSPIFVRLYELKHPVTFEKADFFSLYERSEPFLAHDLAATESLELSPGETRELKLSVGDGNRYIGVFAAYRDIAETRWRYTVEIIPKRVTSVDLTLDHSGIHNTHETLAKGNDWP